MRTTVALHHNCTFYRAFHLSQTASHSSELHFTKHLPITVTSSEVSCLLCPKSLLRKTKILMFCYALYLLLATSSCYCTSTPCEMRGPSNARWSRPSAIFPPPNIDQSAPSAKMLSTMECMALWSLAWPRTCGWAGEGVDCSSQLLFCFHSASTGKS